jgi:hypothetical protein
MFAKLHSDINSLKPGLLHFTSQLESRAAKVKMELETKFLGTILVDQYSITLSKSNII